MNFDRLRHVAERADIGEQREALFAVEIPEQPGSFLKFCQALGNAQRHRVQLPLRTSATRRRSSSACRSQAAEREKRAARSQLSRRPAIASLDMTDNEMAKLHVRYMVGGHARGVANERLYPLRISGAARARCCSFLQAIGTRWNISLFHYRNHGSDHGRVLAGVQVPPADADEFAGHLRELRYEYTEETANPAYRMFLS